MLASVGFVKEDALNIVPLKIGEIDGSSDIYDLAVLYTKTPVSVFRRDLPMAAVEVDGGSKVESPCKGRPGIRTTQK